MITPGDERSDPPPGAGPRGVEDVLGRRIAAALIDIAILFVLFTVLAATSGDSRLQSGRLSSLPSGAALLYVSLVLVYYFSGEAITGQTPGKRMLGLRVMSAEGGRASPRAVAIRTLLRMIDNVPGLYALGLLVVLATGPRRQRLGDLAAKTVVRRA